MRQLKRVLQSCIIFVQELSPKLVNEVSRRNQMRIENDNKWFLPEEEKLVETLAKYIVPSDENTPGVNEMDVLGPSIIKVLEKMIVKSEKRKVIYLEGIIVLENISEKKFNKKFPELSEDDVVYLLKCFDITGKYNLYQNTLMKRIKRNLFIFRAMLNRSFPAIEMFSQLKQDVLEAFYTSEVSWIWLGYDGPPMPLGYEKLDVSRPRKISTGGQAIKELAVSIELPNLNPPKKVADVVIVGSGAGGAVVAKELAESGLSVVVIEVGKRFNPYIDYPTDRIDFESIAPNVFDDPRGGLRDLYTVANSNEFLYGRVKGVGGSTLKYAACVPRFHESDFRVRTEDGLADDWPISYKDLEPFYTRVEYALGVSGPTGLEANPYEPPRSRPYPTPAHKFNMASLAIKRGAEKIGLHLVREPLAIPTIEWDGRPACINAGTCTLGCAITAKSSMDVTFIQKAEKTGKLEIRTECMAHRVTVSPDGKASGVVYFDREGRENEIQAKVVVLSGNAVETPRILLLSETGRFPNGLANSSGLVGKYFTEHLYVLAYGLFSDRLDPWRGTPTGGIMQDHYKTNPSNDFARGWTTYVNGSNHWPFSVAKRVPGWGEQHKIRMKQIFSHHIGLVTVGEQLPNVRNQVSLDTSVKDIFGLPVPRLKNDLYDNDLNMIKAIKINLQTIFESSGAIEIIENVHQPGGSAHYFGTCRMGLNPQSSIVNEFGRSHDIKNLFIADGSVFVTGAAANPALTIAALALRTSTYIKKYLNGVLK